MTIQETRNEKLAAKLIKALESRGMEAFYCATSQEAVAKAMELIPDGSSVSWGGSMTIRDMGLTDALKERGSLTVFDQDAISSPEEAEAYYVGGFKSDVFLASANAISEDGVIVSIDGRGNRVAAITFGPKKVIFMVGMNKVCQTVDAALARARSTAAPINSQRFDLKTPCKVDGVCHNCKSPDSICNYVHFLRHSPGHRHTVILVGENLGY